METPLQKTAAIPTCSMETTMHSASEMQIKLEEWISISEIHHPRSGELLEWHKSMWQLASLSNHILNQKTLPECNRSRSFGYYSSCSAAFHIRERGTSWSFALRRAKHEVALHKKSLFVGGRFQLQYRYVMHHASFICRHNATQHHSI